MFARVTHTKQTVSCSNLIRFNFFSLILIAFSVTNLNKNILKNIYQRKLTLVTIFESPFGLAIDDNMSATAILESVEVSLELLAVDEYISERCRSNRLSVAKNRIDFRLIVMQGDSRSNIQDGCCLQFLVSRRLDFTRDESSIPAVGKALRFILVEPTLPCDSQKLC